MLAESDPGLRRVAVHAGTARVDLALPAAVPVAALIPSIIDNLEDIGDPVAIRYQLSRLGASALGGSTTLGQNDIRDGTVLVLTPSSTELPAPCFDDVAEALSTTLDTVSRPWTRRAARLTAAVAAIWLAAVAGFLAVPGVPGAPNVLLAATAAAVTAVIATRATGCGTVTLTAVACFAAATAVVALAATITAAPFRVIGSISAAVSLGILEASARVSILLAGLSPDTASNSLATRAIRADGWLTSLVCAFSTSAAVGAVSTAVGTHTAGGIAFAIVTSAVLLLRARSQADLTRTLVLLGSGIATTGAAFIIVAASWPRPGPWIALTAAMLAAAALWLGFAAPAMSFSPVARRSVELLEYLSFTTVVPLTCWVCGLYGAARGMNQLWP